MVPQAKPLNSTQPQAVEKPSQTSCGQRSVLSVQAKQLGQVVVLFLLSWAQAGD